MRAATEGSLPPVMPQGNLVEVLGREVRQGSPGELMVESTPSRQRRPPCKTNKEMSDEAADAAALTYLFTYSFAAERRLQALRHCLSLMEARSSMSSPCPTRALRPEHLRSSRASKSGVDSTDSTICTRGALGQGS